LRSQARGAKFFLVTSTGNYGRDKHEEFHGWALAGSHSGQERAKSNSEQANALDASPSL
jgi:hypothetical protein